MKTREQDFRAWAGLERPALRRTAYLLCGDWFLADDLVQDALLRVYDRWDRIAAGGNNPSAYCRRVVLRLFLDHRRGRWWREVPVEQLPDRDFAMNPTVEASSSESLLRALRRVPPGQRAVLILRFWEDLTMQEIASAMGTTVGNVKSQSSRGLAALRTAMAEEGLDGVVLDVEVGR